MPKRYNSRKNCVKSAKTSKTILCIARPKNVNKIQFLQNLISFISVFFDVWQFFGLERWCTSSFNSNAWSYLSRQRNRKYFEKFQQLFQTTKNILRLAEKQKVFENSFKNEERYISLLKKWRKNETKTSLLAEKQKVFWKLTWVIISNRYICPDREIEGI